MRWPLRRQILVPFTGTILAVIVAITAINAYWAADRSAAQIHRQLAKIGATMQESQFPLTVPVLQQARGLSGAEFVVADSNGNVVAQSLPEAEHIEFGRPESLTHGELPATLKISGADYLHLEIQRSRRAPEAPLTIHILYPLTVWKEAQWQAAWPPVLVGTGALLFVVAIAIGLADRISRPLRQVTDQITSIAHHDLRTLPLPSTDDEIRQLVSSVNALVSELATMTDAVKRSERLAMLGQLSGGLAHHLRNGVTGAILALQLHRRRCESDPESLIVAQRQLELTEEHLKRFLAIGQPQPLERVPTGLSPWAEELADLVRPACVHRGVKLVLLPPATDLVAFVDGAQLRQAVMNLLMNAIEAAGSGGDVTFEFASSDRERIIMRVSDSGPGPGPDIEQRLFEPFATSKSEGVGLGLAVARQIVEAHQGQVDFRRIDGRCCFEVRLPRVVPPETADVPNAEHRIAVASVPEKGA